MDFLLGRAFNGPAHKWLLITHDPYYATTYIIRVRNNQPSLSVKVENRTRIRFGEEQQLLVLLINVAAATTDQL